LKRDATLGDVVKLCPFRTLLGRGVTANSIPSMTVAVLGGDPEPISREWMKEIVATLQDGGTVEILSDRADLRDYAKREIRAMATPPGGRAS
jgi:hypothetical protein